MTSMLITAFVALPVVLAVFTASGLWRRHSAALGGAVSGIGVLGFVVAALPAGTVDWDIVLLGSQLQLDTATRIATAVASALFVAFGLQQRRRLAESPGVTAAFLLCWAGVLTQCLSAELLLFLTAAAVAGYSMLAVTIATARPTPEQTLGSAAAIAFVLVLGDLALLELATLLVEVRVGSLYRIAAETLTGMRGQTLVELCIALGLAARLTLPLAVLYWGRGEMAALRQTSFGWFAVAACSVLASWRLAPGGADSGAIPPWIAELAWVMPLLPVVLFLPAAMRGLLRGIDAFGRTTSSVQSAVLGLLPRTDIDSASATLRGVEARLLRWSTATSALILLAIVLFLLLR